jgi:hypothetical protein
MPSLTQAHRARRDACTQSTSVFAACLPSAQGRRASLSSPVGGHVIRRSGGPVSKAVHRGRWRRDVGAGSGSSCRRRRVRPVASRCRWHEWHRTIGRRRADGDARAVARVGMRGGPSRARAVRRVAPKGRCPGWLGDYISHLAARRLVSGSGGSGPSSTSRLDETDSATEGGFRSGELSTAATTRWIV